MDVALGSGCLNLWSNSMRYLSIVFAVLAAAASPYCWAINDDDLGSVNGLESLQKGRTDGTFDFAEFAAVNLLNGNVSATIPLGQVYSLPGGYSYGLSLYYDSNSWVSDPGIECIATTGGPGDDGEPQRRSVPALVPNRLRNSGFGWMLNPGVLIAPSSGPLSESSYWLYIGEDGSRIQFSPDFPYSPDGSGAGQLYYSADARTRLRAGSSLQIDLPNGVELEFEASGQPRDGIGTVHRLTRKTFNPWAEPASQSFVAYSYGNEAAAFEWIISDSSGRQHVISLEQPYRLVSDITGPAPGPTIISQIALAGFEPIYFVYAEAHENSQNDGIQGFQNQWISLYGCGVLDPLSTTSNPADRYLHEYFLESIVLPDNSTYDFIYYTNNNSGSIPGALQQARMPTGLRYHFDYAGDYRFYYHPNDRHPSGVLEDMPGISRKVRFWSDYLGAGFVDPDTVPELQQAIWTYHPSGHKVQGASNTETTECYARRDVIEHQWIIDELGNVEIINGSAQKRQVKTSSFFNSALGAQRFAPHTRCNPFNDNVFDTSTGPYLSQALYDDERLVETVWVKPVSVVYRPSVVNSSFDHKVEILREVKYHNGNPDQVLAATVTENKNYDGFGHFSENTISHQCNHESCGGPGSNWGETRTTRQSFDISDADADGSLDNTNLIFSSFGPVCANSLCLDRVNSTLPEPPTAIYLQLDRQNQVSVTAASGASLREICTDEKSGKPLASRLRKNPAQQSDEDIFNVHGYNATGDQNLSLLFGGDSYQGGGQLSRSICEIATLAEVDDFGFAETVTHTSYSNGIPKQSFVEDCDGTRYSNLDVTLDPVTGRIESERDITGLRTQYSYDNMGRLIQTETTAGVKNFYRYTRPSLSGPQANEYAQIGCAANVLTAGDCPDNLRFGESAMTFSPLGHPLSIIKRTDNQQPLVKQWIYDPFGRKLADSHWVREGQTVAAYFYSTNFDYAGRSRKQIRPDGSFKTIEFAQGHDWMVSETSRGGGYSVTAGQLRTHVSHFDGWKNLIRSEEQQSGSSITGNYQYDFRNQLTSVCVGVMTGNNCNGQQRTFAYDPRGFLTRQTHPELSGSVFVYPSRNARGLPTQQTVLSASGQVVEDYGIGINYDGLGRIISVTALNNNRKIKEFFYAKGNQGAQNYSAGKLVEARRHNYIENPINGAVEEFSVVSRYSYNDANGNVSQIILSLPGSQTFVSDFLYDVTGRLTGYGYPGCTTSGCDIADTTITYDYQRASLKAVNLNNQPLVTVQAFQPSGAPAIFLRNNGVLDTRELDSYGWRLASMYSDLNGQNLWRSGRFTYDWSSNISSIGARQYKYDQLDRLTHASVEFGGEQWEQAISYDEYGNITVLQSGPPGELEDLFSDLTVDGSSNRITGPNISYDVVGAVVSGLYGGKQFSFERNVLGQIAMSQSDSDQSAFIYDADDERIGSYSFSDGQYLFTLRDKENQIVRKLSIDNELVSHEADWIHGFGQVLAMVDQSSGNSQITHLHTDYLGSVRFKTDTSGSVVDNQIFDYLPFGTAFPVNPPTDITFTGQERDEDSNLNYMHARFYSPELARFLSPDPVLGRIGASQSWNRYAYVGNNPIRRVDPDGRQEVEAGEDARAANARARARARFNGYTGRITQANFRDSEVMLLQYDLVRHGMNQDAADFWADEYDSFLVLIQPRNAKEWFGAAAWKVAEYFGGKIIGTLFKAAKDPMEELVEAAYKANGEMPVTVVGRGMSNVEYVADVGGDRVQTILDLDNIDSIRWSDAQPASYQTRFNHTLESGCQLVICVNMNGQLANPSEFFQSELEALSRNADSVVVPLDFDIWR